MFFYTARSLYQIDESQKLVRRIEGLNESPFSVPDMHWQACEFISPLLAGKRFYFTLQGGQEWITGTVTKVFQETANLDCLAMPRNVRAAAA